MKDRYSISYGCDEWQEEMADLSLKVAFKKFKELTENAPSMGLYPATYILLKENGIIIDSWEN